MIVTYELDPSQELTEEEKEEIRKACEREPVPDEDCPELSESMLKSLKAAVRNRNRREGLPQSAPQPAPSASHKFRQPNQRFGPSLKRGRRPAGRGYGGDE